MKRARISVPKRPAWLVPLDDPRDEALLSVAFDVFAAKGFHGATMLDIATEAGCSKKTLYARFTDKAALFRALLAWGARQNLPDALPPEDVDAEAALRVHAQRVAAALFRPESIRLMRIVMGEAERFPEIAQHFDEATRTASAAIVEELARRLARARLIRGRDAAQFADDFIALVRGDLFFRVLMGAVKPPSPAAQKAHAEAAINRLLRLYSS